MSLRILKVGEEKRPSQRWFHAALCALLSAAPPREPLVACRSNTYPKGFYCSWHQQHPAFIPTSFEVDVQ